MLKAAERRKAMLQGRDIEWDPIEYLPLAVTFRSAGFSTSLPSPGALEPPFEEYFSNLSICAILEEIDHPQGSADIYLLPPGSILSNWSTTDIMIVDRSAF